MSMERNFPRNHEHVTGHIDIGHDIGNVGNIGGIGSIGSIGNVAWTPSHSSDVGLAGYRLGARLDDFGAIYEGHHPRVPGQLVIKLFGRLTGKSTAAVAAFSREAGRVSILRHPHIARVLDSGVFGDRAPFVAMERLHGRTLEEHLVLRGALPVAHLLPVLRGVVSALSAAHAAGVVHREIRPDNVFLVGATDGDPGVVKVLDFGVSRLTWAEGSDRRGVGADDVRYLAPEQVHGVLQDIDPRADQYAVAALVCRMLHGTASLPGNPVAGRSVERAEVRSRLDNPVMQRVSAVKDVLSKALSESPGGRYSSVTAFLHAFEQALAGSASDAPVVPAKQVLAPARHGDSAPIKPLEVTTPAPDPRPRPDPAGRDGALTKRFFQEGDLQEKNRWKNSPLALETVPPNADIGFTSFDHLPRRRKPLVAVAMIVLLAGAGTVAWRAGWPSPGKILRESRVARTAYLLRAGLPGRAMIATTMGDPGVHIQPSGQTAAGVPAAAAVMAAGASPQPIAMGQGQAAATASLTGSDTPGTGTPEAISAPGRPASPQEIAEMVPEARIVPSPQPAIPPETVPPDRESLTPAAVAARALPGAADVPRRKHTTALRGYVWSPADHRLVPSDPVVAPPPAPPSSADINASTN
jgi:serine/threonine protein kinase